MKISIDISEHPSHSPSLYVPLSFEDWQSMKKVSYKLYWDIYIKNWKAKNTIEKVSSSYQKELVEGNRQPGGPSSWAHEAPDATPEHVTFWKAIEKLDAIEQH